MFGLNLCFIGLGNNLDVVQIFLGGLSIVKYHEK